MNSPLRHLWTIPFCLLAIASLTTLSVAQLCPTGTARVTTWHNDLSRTGWQQDETLLTADPTQQGYVTQGNFGPLWQWQVAGRVYAQPLAVSSVPISGCTNNCPNMVFIATNEDMLYAFNAASSSNAAIWSRDLAGYLGGTFVNCASVPPPNWSVCTGKTEEDLPTPFTYTDVGVIGTPVIDPSTNTLYVAAAVEISSVINYYLFAVDITSGSVKTYKQIAGSVPGSQTPPTPKCTTGGSGTTQSFDINHIQRSGLLLLNGIVYVSFAPLPEASESGWMFGYSLSVTNGSNYALSQVSAFSSTPHGTGGGIWGSGAAPASDGMDIFVATGNGTFDLIVSNPMDNDAGDSLLKLQPPTAPSTLLTISDYFTPYDVFSWDSNGLCPNDEDFGSGGVLLPPNFMYTNTGECSGSGCKVAITADKQSNVYVTDKDYLGKANLGSSCAGSTNDIECVTTPFIPPNDPAQGYWGSPAYLWYTSGGQTYNMLYYSVDAPLTVTEPGGGPGTPHVAPMPINGYQLQPSSTVGPPIPMTPTASTSTLFCQYSPTPSVSSSGTTAPLSGIVWAIEQNQNNDNNGVYSPPDCAGTQSLKPALHAFCATAGSPTGPCPTALAELYNSRRFTGISSAYFGFPTPTVFNGYVYMGANGQVAVFGLCVNGSHGECEQ